MKFKRTTKRKEEIETFFKEYIYGYMFNDIDQSSKAKSNYLAALGLMTLTEFLGGLATGKLGQEGESRRNFNAALKWFDYPGITDYYSQFSLELKGSPHHQDIYSLVRCGLSHEYFIKGVGSGVANDHTGMIELMVDKMIPRYPGVWYDPKTKAVKLFTNYYFVDLKDAFDRYKKAVLEDPDLMEMFFKAVGTLESRRFKKLATIKYWKP